MNILFSSDDNYARHLGVAILSILSHNEEVKRIHFFVINNHISLTNIAKLESIVNKCNNADILFIPFDSFEKQLHLNLSWPISLSSYARLFVGEILPTTIERVLYLDCDVIIRDSLEQLWNIDLEGHYLGAIQDTIPSKTKIGVGLLPQLAYFNAGVLLIDLFQWRKNKIGKCCLEFIESHHGTVIHHDQGILNGILFNEWKRLPLKYNVMTIHYMMSQSKIKSFFKDESTFYDLAEIEEAINNPIIVHFTPSLTNRPWEKHCNHPLRNLYNNYLNCTPWNGFPLVEDNNPWYVNVLNFIIRNLPFSKFI